MMLCVHSSHSARHKLFVIASVCNLQEVVMFTVHLYDEPSLQGLSRGQKEKVINKAVKLYRKDYPIDIKKRVGLVVAICFFPALILFYLLGSSSALAWAVISSLALGFRFSARESVGAKTYIHQVLKQ